MRIGIDIDGVITNSFKDYENEYVSKICYDRGINILDVDSNAYYIQQAYNLSEKEDVEFWREMLADYVATAVPRMYVSQILKKLQEEGHYICLVTARENHVDFDAQKATKQWLAKHDIPYDKIIFDGNKRKHMLEEKLDIMIEDAPHNIESVYDVVDTLVMDAVYNKHVPEQKAKRVVSWYQIYSYIQHENEKRKGKKK